MSNKSTEDLAGPAGKRQPVEDTEKPLADELSHQDLDKVSGGLGQAGKRLTPYDDGFGSL